MSEDVITTKQNIEICINELKKLEKSIRGLSNKRADAIGKYEKILGVRIMELKNGKEFVLNGEPIKNPPTTIVEKVARGLCWKEKIEMEKADTMYKNLTKVMQSIEARLNGWQSVNKYTDK